MSVVAFIPVKESSSRLPGKNWLPFGESTLLQDKIRQLQSVEGLTEILVSTDSEMLADLAIKEGATVEMRPKSLADESRHISDFVRYAAELANHDHLLWACVTSPNLRADRFREILDRYFTALDEGFDSLATVYPFQHFVLDESGPLNFGRGEKHLNSENLPKWWIFTNGATITPIPSMKKWADRLGPNPYRFEVSLFESTDIDYLADYELALAIHDWTERKA